MIKWIKTLFRIVKNYDKDMQKQENQISSSLETIDQIAEIIRERTVCHADIHMKSRSTIIVVGRYRNQDYVQAFQIPDEDWLSIVKRLKEMEKYHQIGRIDAPVSFSASFKSEFWKD